MFVFKRNQVIITALVLMIAVAGYLSYVDQSGVDDRDFSLNTDGDINALVLDNMTGQEVMVSNVTASGQDGETNGSAENSTGNSTREPGSAVFVNTTNDSSFFVQAKLSREQNIAKQKEVLTALINNSNIEKEQKATYAAAMLAIQQKLEKEASAEEMIQAKGFSEVYVNIDENTVDVVVGKTMLNDSELAQIEDIIKRKTGVSVENIRISPHKQ